MTAAITPPTSGKFRCFSSKSVVNPVSPPFHLTPLPPSFTAVLRSPRCSSKPKKFLLLFVSCTPARSPQELGNPKPWVSEIQLRKKVIRVILLLLRLSVKGPFFWGGFWVVSAWCGDGKGGIFRASLLWSLPELVWLWVLWVCVLARICDLGVLLILWSWGFLVRQEGKGTVFVLFLKLLAVFFFC